MILKSFLENEEWGNFFVVVFTLFFSCLCDSCTLDKKRRSTLLECYTPNEYDKSLK